LLARVIGPYMLIVGVALFVNRQRLTDMLDDYARQPMLSFVIGAMTLIIGLLAVQFHNVWRLDWRLLVTIICWLTLIKGACALVIPDALVKMADFYKGNDALLNIQTPIAILFGAYMSYMGYFA